MFCLRRETEDKWQLVQLADHWRTKWKAMITKTIAIITTQKKSDECPQLVNVDVGSPLKHGLTVTRFDELKDKISENTLKAIKDMEFTQMTEIQAKTIPQLLEGK